LKVLKIARLLQNDNNTKTNDEEKHEMEEDFNAAGN
jgi:hypothetical protein